MSSTIQFDEADPRLSSSANIEGSVLASILRATSSTGIDPIAELYNEALALAKEGHYGDARSRLQVLLGLAPSDADARLLLAKVYVAGQQWRRALGALDEAAQCGAHVPDTLRDAVLRHLQADDADSQSEARSVRENAEIKKLRSEARRLRSENAHLSATSRKLEREAKGWALVAAVTAVVAIVLLLVQMITSTSEAPADQAELAAVEATPDADGAPAEASDDAPEAAPTPVAEAPAAAPPAGGSALDRAAAAAVADAAPGAPLAVEVRQGTAILTGTVPMHAPLKAALVRLLDVDGIDEVDASEVVNLARRDGTTYEVRNGDNLSVIAYRHYGNEALYKAVLDANPSLGGKPALKVGQRLTIPAVAAD